MDTNEENSTALSLNSDAVKNELMKEVQDEFLTSDREVYKAGLRSLVIQEQKLNKQIASIQKDIKELHEAREALGQAFTDGELQSVEDARGVVRKVRVHVEMPEEKDFLG